MDDEIGFLKQAKKILESKKDSLNIDTVNAPKKGLELLEKREYDAVVSDYQMPRKSGLEFLKIIREEKNLDIPFIVFTGKGREEIAMRSLNLGADRYLQKGGDSKSQYGVLAQAIIQEVNHYKTQNELKKSSKKFEKLFKTIPDPAFLLNTEGVIQEINEAFLELIDLDEEEIIGSSIRDPPRFIPQKSQQEIVNSFEKSMDGQETSPYSIEVETDGEEKLILEINTNIIEENGNITGEVVIARDITKVRNIKKELSFESNLFGSLLDNIPDSVYFKDRNNRFIKVSKSKLEHLGIGEEEILGKTDFDFYPEEQAEEMAADDKKVMETGKPIKKEEKVKRPTGEEAWVSVIKAPRHNENDNIIGTVGISRNITERKEKEEELKIKNHAIESSLNGLAISDLDGKLTYVNSSFLDMWGYDKREEVEGRKVSEFWDEEEKALKVANEIKNDKEWFGEMKAEKSDGTVFPVQVSASEIKNKSGETIGMVSSFMDLTGEKEIEERKEFLHSLLRHNVRNKAEVVSNYLDLMGDLDLSEEGEKYREEAYKTIRNAIGIIQKVRTLNKLEKEETKKVHLNTHLQKAVNEMHPLASKEGIEIEHETCRAEVGGGILLEDLFSNLLENSILHSEGDLIRISVTEKDKECIISIEDNGIGIKDEDKEKVFERGFKVGGSTGSGLGLYLVKEILNRHGGDIEIGDSEMGGAKFDIHLRKV